jgi:tetratricopeptide (TPR) repeat protein
MRFISIADPSGLPVMRLRHESTPREVLKKILDATFVVHSAYSLEQAWRAIFPLLTDHEKHQHKTGDYEALVLTLNKCAQALCERFSLETSTQIQAQLFRWIHLALRLDAENSQLWMLWALALRKADQPQRARWVLWDMTRRFPYHLPCRVELARLLADSPDPAEKNQVSRLLQQVLQLDPKSPHVHFIRAQLAIRRRDWPEALTHAQESLRIEPDNEACALLLATAHDGRNEAGDLQTAIEHLQRFVSHYPGNLNAEGYLGNLCIRQQLAAHGRLAEWEDDESSAKPTAAPAETDVAWRAFAESIQTWIDGDDAVSNTYSDERLLPLPQAMRQAIVQNRWEADVLESYNETTKREFPLETRLWRYLQVLRSDAPEGKRERARQDVQAWVDAEAHASSQVSDSRLSYLTKHWTAMDAANDDALASGKDWLCDLLNSYQPLPAPLYA